MGPIGDLRTYHSYGGFTSRNYARQRDTLLQALLNNGVTASRMLGVGGTLVPQLGNGVSSEGEAYRLVRASHLNTPVRRDEPGAPRLLKRLAGVGPVERMGHRRVVIDDELSELRFEVGHRGEAAAAQAFPVDDAEDDLDLVEPRAVLGQVDEADPVADVREGRATRRHRPQDAANVFFPRGSATS